MEWPPGDHIGQQACMRLSVTLNSAESKIKSKIKIRNKSKSRIKIRIKILHSDNSLEQSPALTLNLALDPLPNLTLTLSLLPRQCARRIRP